MTNEPTASSDYGAKDRKKSSTGAAFKMAAHGWALVLHLCVLAFLALTHLSCQLLSLDWYKNPLGINFTRF